MAPPVRIGTSVYGGHVTIEVRDNGRSIPEDALWEVLGRFRRDDTTVLTRPGSGLGLYVTRRLVDGMGGGLEVWSERGAGCRASIRLPLHVATGPATGQPVARPVDRQVSTCLSSTPMSDVYKALADPTRRVILDELQERADQTLFELCTRLAVKHSLGSTRQAVSQHLDVLEAAGLVVVRRSGRYKLHTFDPTPLSAIAARWPVPRPQGDP
jgi:DNA-binding transcriptional ArsR family regulator